MSEFTQNDSKPEKLLTGYNTVRGAELKEMCDLLESQGDVTVSAFTNRFGKPEVSGPVNDSHVDQCVRFLRTIDVVKISPQNVVSQLNREVYPHLPAEPRLLHHIRSQRGEQYHLAYIADVAFDQGSRRLTVEDLFEAVRDDVDRSFGLTWRTENIKMWANLFDHLGGITYANQGGENWIVVSPARRLLYDLLSWYAENGSESNQFVSAMEWIDEEFLPVFSERAGTPRVAMGVADVLNDMEEDGVVTLNVMSDTQNVAAVPRSEKGSRQVVTFDVRPVEERPSYRYPLRRNEREVLA